MPRQIQGSQTDFSFGEVDVALKRNDQHPARKSGLRQMANARILNSGAVQERSGRSALFPISGNCTRIEEFILQAGSIFKIGFGPGWLQIVNSAGAVVANFTTQGNGAALPWASQADIKSIVYAPLNFSVYITFGHSMRPQVLTWDGVATWSIADYTELVIGNQKRTPFYRISPQNITLHPGAQSGSGVALHASAPLFVPGHIGTRMRFVNRQVLITGFVGAQDVVVTVEESLPGHQDLTFATAPSAAFSVGDVVIGGTSGSKGIVTAVGPLAIDVQLIATDASVVIVGYYEQRTVSFQTGEAVVGPGGSLTIGSAGPIDAPTLGVSFWDEEVMNDFRGYPASCFVDQFRLGFCDFPDVPGGIAWSSINSPTDLYVGGPTVPNGAMFEIAPEKVRVYYVVPGPESSEFVFCDRKVYYIPISPTNPLVPGSVSFQILSGDGSAQVIPRKAQEAILYVNAGANSVMAVIATGAYLRPFNTKNLNEFHAHLFNGIQAIAAPSADGTFNERYAYVLNGDGSIAVGKYKPESLSGNLPVIGWGPWSGAGAVSWIAAFAADVIFTSKYFGVGICEILDDSQYLDCALPVNALPAAFTPPGGKGPLWFIPSQTVSLMDQVTRSMGTYQIDVNGFIVPQGNGGENLAIASLVAGQPWTMVVEPFAQDAQSGQDMHQRMLPRRISYFAVYVVNSTGLVLAKLFSSKLTPTSPALGTIVNTRRVPPWNIGDDPTKPPPLRETVEEWRPSGYSYDPRVAIIKDTPGPLMIEEVAVEISI